MYRDLGELKSKNTASNCVVTILLTKKETQQIN